MYCGRASREAYVVRSHAGTQVLIGLEALLRPAELAKATVEKKRAIFLLLFGTVLAISYTVRLDDNTAKEVSIKVRNYQPLNRRLTLLISYIPRVIAYESQKGNSSNFEIN
jgi:hypothetical protein